MKNKVLLMLLTLVSYALANNSLSEGFTENAKIFFDFQQMSKTTLSLEEAYAVSKTSQDSCYLVSGNKFEIAYQYQAVSILVTPDSVNKKSFSNPSGMSSFYANCQVSDGVLAVGTAQDNSGAKYGIVFKLNSQNEVMWTKEFKTVNRGCEFFGISKIDENQLVITGTKQDVDGYWNNLLLVVNASGQIISENIYKTGMSGVGRKVLPLSDGGFLIGGLADGSFASLLKIKADKSIHWEKRFKPFNYISAVNSFVVNPENEIIAVGYGRYNNNGEVSLKKAFITKLDLFTGDLIDVKAIGFIGDNNLKDIVIRDASIIAVGYQGVNNDYTSFLTTSYDFQLNENYTEIDDNIFIEDKFESVILDNTGNEIIAVGSTYTTEGYLDAIFCVKDAISGITRNQKILSWDFKGPLINNFCSTKAAISKNIINYWSVNDISGIASVSGQYGYNGSLNSFTPTKIGPFYTGEIIGINGVVGEKVKIKLTATDKIGNNSIDSCEIELTDNIFPYPIIANDGVDSVGPGLFIKNIWAQSPHAFNSLNVWYKLNSHGSWGNVDLGSMIDTSGYYPWYYKFTGPILSIGDTLLYNVWYEVGGKGNSQDFIVYCRPNYWLKYANNYPVTVSKKEDIKISFQAQNKSLQKINKIKVGGLFNNIVLYIKQGNNILFQENIPSGVEEINANITLEGGFDIVLEGVDKAIKASKSSNQNVKIWSRELNDWVLADFIPQVECLMGEAGDPSSLSEKNLPNEIGLAQNYPNPFNPITTIIFTLPNNGDVKLSVFNIKGELVKTLVSGTYKAGNNKISFDGSNLTSGVYVYKLITPQKSITKKMMLIK